MDGWISYLLLDVDVKVICLMFIQRKAERERLHAARLQRAKENSDFRRKQKQALKEAR